MYAVGLRAVFLRSRAVRVHLDAVFGHVEDRFEHPQIRQAHIPPLSGKQ